MLCYTILPYIELYDIVLYYVMLHYTVFRNLVLHHVLSHYIELYPVVLHFTTLYYMIFFLYDTVSYYRMDDIVPYCVLLCFPVLYHAILHSVISYDITLTCIADCYSAYGMFTITYTAS